MPGLFGIVGSADERSVAPRFASLRSSMRATARTKDETEVGSGERWALGRIHLGTLQPEPQLGRGGKIRVLFNGDLHNLAELRSEIERRGERPPSDACDVIAALYARDELAFIPRLKGAFCAVILDEARGRLVLVTDRFGTYPLYWFHGQRGFTFASELRAVVRDHPKPALDLETVATIASLGFPLGEGTLAAGILLVPPASTVTFDWKSGAATVERYAALADSFRPTDASQADYYRELNAAFVRAMDHAVSGDARFGLSLSGGLDTRVLLSALDRLHVPLSTFTIGGKGCADEVIAEQLSQMANTEHRFIELGNQYLDDLVPNMRRMVSLTDGMYISHGFTETLALQAFEQSNFSVLLRGHAGELAKTSTAWPLHTDAAINGMQTTEQFLPYMVGRLDSYYYGGSLRGVFTGPGAEMFDDGHARQILERIVRDVPLAPPDLCSYLYLHEYHRRVTVPSLEIFRHVVDVRMPLADPDFMDVVLRGRRSWRENTEIHRELIHFNSRRFLSVRNTNTGARAGAGPREEWVFDKLNSVLRRLNVHGYRHYHGFFDGWMRKAFLDSVERVLLSPEALGRGNLNAAAVKGLLGEAKQGAHTHDHVLQVLTTVELWQQENL